MTNNEHAKELEAQAMMYPQGDVFDALMAGAAALRGAGANGINELRYLAEDSFGKKGGPRCPLTSTP